MQVDKKSYAKINLALKVLNRRIDGFHNIETIFTSISLHDTIRMETHDTIEVVCSDPSIPSGADNIAFKAAELIKSAYAVKSGVRIQIEKNIPSGAGLAGGSGNAAAVIKGCLELWQLPNRPRTINTVLQKLGSDVPYCYYGGTSLGTGRGEKLRRLPPFRGYSIVIVNPLIHVSTPLAYAMLNKRLTKSTKKYRLSVRYHRFLTKDHLLSDLLVNDFEQVVFEKYPLIYDIKSAFLRLGADGALMSGSGSTVFALFRERINAVASLSFFKEKGYWVYEAEPVDYAIER